MLFLWAVCMVPFGAYAIIQNFTVAILVQPQLFSLLCLICWGQTLFYHNKYKAWQATLVAIATGAIFGGTELALALTLRGPYSRGLQWPVTFLGILATVLLAVGLVFPYIEMWKNKGRVVGISFRFLAIDFAGALFSLLALTVQNTFDRLGGASYITVMILEIGIVLGHLSWLWRSRKLRKAAKEAGRDYDEYVSSMDAGRDTVRRSFVRIRDVPSDWPKTARVSAILSALRNFSYDEEKATETSEAHVENGRSLPTSVRVSALVAAILHTSPESRRSLETTETRQFEKEVLTTIEPPAAITKPVATTQIIRTGEEQGQETERPVSASPTISHAAH